MPDIAVSSVNQNIQNNAVSGAQNVGNNGNVSVPYYRGNLDYPPDSVQLKGQEVKEKKGLSKGTKWGLGTAAFIIAGTAIYFLTRGKIGAKQAQQLAEHIEFKEAKTLEEAIEFGKKHLGIKDYLGFESNNVEALNWINRGLTDVNNYAKGKAQMPTYVTTYAKDGVIASATDYVKELDGHALNFNKDIINDPNTLLNKYFEFLSKNKAIIKENEAFKINDNIFAADDVTGGIEKLLNRYKTNSKDLSFADKMTLYQNMEQLITVYNGIYASPLKSIEQIFKVQNFKNITLSNGKILTLDDIAKMTTDEQSHILRSLYRAAKGKLKFKVKASSPYETIYHETGHIQHQYLVGDKYNKMCKLEEFEERGVVDKSITEDFLNDQMKQQTAARVSPYATTSPLEFVAETFAKLVKGEKLPDEVISLYKHYGGPMFG